MELDDDLIYAARIGNLSTLDRQRILDSLNWNGIGGQTLLGIAASNGNASNVLYLIQCGAKLNTRGFFGDSPLMYATRFDYQCIVKMLLEAGADVEHMDNDGVTSLWWALAEKSTKCVKILIDYGARLDKVRKHCPIPPLKGIPKWVTRYVDARECARKAAVLMVGIHKRCSVTQGQDVNVLRIIGKHIWSTRMDEHWENRRIRKKTKP